MPVLVLLTAAITLGPALAVRPNRIPAADAFEVRVGPLRVRGPDIRTPLDDVFPTPTTAPPKSPSATTTSTTTTTSPPPPADGFTSIDRTPGPRTQTGPASWYEGKLGECAHRTIPLRTVVKVLNLENGRSTRCTVTNRGPYRTGRIIDLSRGSFAEIAQLSKGVVEVRIEW